MIDTKDNLDFDLKGYKLFKKYDSLFIKTNNNQICLDSIPELRQLTQANIKKKIKALKSKNSKYLLIIWDYVPTCLLNLDHDEIVLNFCTYNDTDGIYEYHFFDNNYITLRNLKEVFIVNCNEFKVTTHQTQYFNCVTNANELIGYVINSGNGYRLYSFSVTGMSHFAGHVFTDLNFHEIKQRYLYDINELSLNISNGRHSTIIDDLSKVNEYHNLYYIIIENQLIVYCLSLEVEVNYLPLFTKNIFSELLAIYRIFDDCFFLVYKNLTFEVCDNKGVGKVPIASLKDIKMNSILSDKTLYNLDTPSSPIVNSDVLTNYSSELYVTNDDLIHMFKATLKGKILSFVVHKDTKDLNLNCPKFFLLMQEGPQFTISYKSNGISSKLYKIFLPIINNGFINVITPEKLSDDSNYYLTLQSATNYITVLDVNSEKLTILRDTKIIDSELPYRKLLVLENTKTATKQLLIDWKQFINNVASVYVDKIKCDIYIKSPDGNQKIQYDSSGL